MILFYFFKKKIRNFFIVHCYCSPSRFTDYCSLITVHRLLFTDYCRRPKLQYNNCIAIQSSAPSPFLATIHHVYCNTKKKPFKSQYNTSIAIQFVVLQYNSSHCTPYIAIQCNTLQYNFPPCCNTIQPSLPACNTIIVLQYNFFLFQPKYNCKVAIQFFFSQDNWAVAQPFLLHLLSKNFFFFFSSFQLLENAQKQILIYIFFSHTCYWKNTQKHKYTFFFFPFLPTTGRYTKKYIYIFFFIF